MFKTLRNSPAHKGGACSLPVPASGQGNPSQRNANEWLEVAGFLVSCYVASPRVRQAVAYFESQRCKA